jgi:protein-S-isoprenylcysteine O-methyltransferase Ste14
MMKKRAYVNDYDINTEVTKEGNKYKEKKNITYHGKYYRIQMDKDKIKKAKWINVIFGIVFFLLFTFLGFLNNESSRIIYVVLPYVLLFLPIFYTNLGTIKLLTISDDMTTKEYEFTIQRMRKTTLSMLILSIACIIGEILYLLRNSITDFASKDYVFLSGILIFAVLALLFMQHQKTINKNIVEIE